MATRLVKTSTSGIYRAHRADCDATGKKARCGCPYTVRWRSAKGFRKRTFATFELAREFKGKIASGEASRQQTTATVASYYEEWIETYRGRTSRGLDQGTRDEYRQSFDRHVLPKLGGRKLRALDSPAIRDWFGDLERDDVPPPTIRKAKAALSVMLATAKEDGAILHNPVTGVRYVPSDRAKARHPKRKRKALTAGDVVAVLNAMPEEWRAFFTVLAQTGVRISELLGLTWKDVHLGDDPHVMVTEQVYRGQRKQLKTEASEARVPLSGTLASWLVELRPAAAGPDDPVFPSMTGEPLSYANVYNRVLRPALIDAGIATVEERDEKGRPTKVDYHGVAFHAFRRACGSLLLSRGRTLKQVQGWLRHAQLTTTANVYMTQVDDNLGSADEWDEILPFDRDARDNTGTTNVREQPQTVDG